MKIMNRQQAFKYYKELKETGKFDEFRSKHPWEMTKKEQDLRLKLKKEQERENVLSKKIDEMVAQEIAAAERRAKAKEEARRKALEAKRKQQQNNAKPSASNGTSPQTKPTQPTVSKETTVVSGGFEANKGRLPWPCKGVMTGHFGLHPHPVLDHVQVNNKGVYIQTAAGSDACAVYDGEVTQVFAIPGNNNAVIVKHGTYRTVYANVTTTYVTAGAKVKKGQKLGRVFVDHENGNKAEVYFMVYKGSTLQNPEIWLVR